MRSLAFFSFLLLALNGCGDDSDPGPTDAGGDVDAGPADTDAGGMDAGGDPDAGPACTTGCDFVEVITAVGHSCARRENGTIRCWGSNEDGQLGDGRMRHGNNCANAGETELVDCAPPVDVGIIDDATQLTGRGFSSCVTRMSDSSVWCWGLQSVSEMEGSDLLPERFDPEIIDGLGPVTDHSDGWITLCALSGGQSRCIWGNGRGQIGDGATMSVRTPFTLPAPMDMAGAAVTFVDVEAASMGQYVCAISDTGSVWCWGEDESFQLGAGNAMRDTCTDGGGFDRRCSFTPIQMMLPMGVTATQLGLGPQHGCLLSGTGSVYCWGGNAYGQLGTGDTMRRETPVEISTFGTGTMTEVRAGARSSCALDDGGQVWCWGGNEFGNLGDGMVSHGMNCGTDAVDCIPTPQMVVGLNDVTTFDMGWRHGCAIRGSNEIWCWGSNGRRQLSQGDSRDPEHTPLMAMGLN